ncbi:MAG: hypothetical protein AMQ22_00037 [Candidatus Methanofastidiosum methylothiophilum]|uniref:Uncharacterized protein n=1 Tax=Candidatus Methanofastidiosum methylothiophilum TaxID=1705564 RepID=A0A150J9T2_9EURY|nr:MAG: hypothetical protein AMQ22_00037 [Candidatus Methanofastidiosum methylthiophilus]
MFLFNFFTLEKRYFQNKEQPWTFKGFLVNIVFDYYSGSLLGIEIYPGFIYLNILFKEFEIKRGG